MYLTLFADLAITIWLKVDQIFVFHFDIFRDQLNRIERKDGMWAEVWMRVKINVYGLKCLLQGI